MTIRDVARVAGVSTSTVSYVLSGKRPVSAETRRRVEHFVAELGYHPHAGARALASKRSHIIALVVPLRTDVYVPVMMEIATYVTMTARKHGYDVLLITNDEGPDGIRRLAASGLADGVILMDVELGDERISTLGELRTQTVLIGLPDDPAGLSCVDHDFSAAGALCVDHLAGLGHREIAFIGYGTGIYRRRAGYAERTLAGFRARAEELRMRFLHSSCEGTYESTAGALGHILCDRPGTTGFVVQNERALGPLLHLLRTRGRIVPDKASVIALCPERLADQYAPALTAVTGAAKELGRIAVEQVISRIFASVRGRRPDDELVLLAPTLTVRESTGPVRLSDPS
ncbi:LacI family DNA-binding transcriptional regulator [Sphaerisporangium sp. NPDC005289]|uniref:LacI family DNA-binding transcriptional regulator n=1 Tax=Sphaerisporangium sp. NPDC005289 TaxID=3155247 RepID=UPI0033B20ACD